MVPHFSSIENFSVRYFSRDGKKIFINVNILDAVNQTVVLYDPSNLMNATERLSLNQLSVKIKREFKR